MKLQDRTDLCKHWQGNWTTFFAWTAKWKRLATRACRWMTCQDLSLPLLGLIWITLFVYRETFSSWVCWALGHGGISSQAAIQQLQVTQQVQKHTGDMARDLDLAILKQRMVQQIVTAPLQLHESSEGTWDTTAGSRAETSWSYTESLDLLFRELRMFQNFFYFYAVF